MLELSQVMRTEPFEDRVVLSQNLIDCSFLPLCGHEVDVEVNPFDAGFGPIFQILRVAGEDQLGHCAVLLPPAFPVRLQHLLEWAAFTGKVQIVEYQWKDGAQRTHGNHSCLVELGTGQRGHMLTGQQLQRKANEG